MQRAVFRGNEFDPLVPELVTGNARTELDLALFTQNLSCGYVGRLSPTALYDGALIDSDCDVACNLCKV